MGLAACLCGGLAFLSFVAGGEGAPPRAAPTGARTGGAPAVSPPAGRPGAGATGGRAGTTGASAGTSAAGGLLRSNAALVAEGRGLFVSSCSACHGLNAEGLEGRAPNLHGVGELAADFYLETGRMPLSYPQQQPFRTKPAFPPRQIDALIAYVGSLGGPPIPTVQPQLGSASRGQELFALNCAGCHQIQARGGIVTGAVVPRLDAATPAQIGEAIRIGPYVMPRFSSGEISDAEVNDIARYIQTTKHPANAGGWGIYRLGPIPEGMVTWLLGLAALILVIRLIGERTPT
jgi:ubiquinol-cytochrome c reductase cytochrome c subunit